MKQTCALITRMDSHGKTHQLDRREDKYGLSKPRLFVCRSNVQETHKKFIGTDHYKYTIFKNYQRAGTSGIPFKFVFPQYIVVVPHSYPPDSGLLLLCLP